ncbi:MAG: DUF748 domain-containing protein [Candidatus Omnitrophica bacterium]|nr:DUF748 domain-containing protein [Candidatus Omnitrophota bacterium]
MMKPWKRTLFIVISALLIFFACTYVFLIFQGKAIIINKLEEFTHKKTSIADFNVTPPFNIGIKNLNIEGLAKIESVSISPSILYVVLGRIAFNRIIITKPEFIFEKGIPKPVETAEKIAEPQAEAPKEAAAPPEKSAAPKIEKKRAIWPLIFKRLTVKDGKIDFTDHTAGQSGIKINVKDLNFNLTNLYMLPVPVITNFDLKAKIPWQEGQEEGKIEVEGWLNLFKRDIRAVLNIKDIDGVYLYPYYSNWVDLEKARIEKAKLNFTSNITGLSNNLTAECHLELVDIVRKPRSPEEQQEKAEKIADAVLDMFRALNEGKIVLDFTIRTKMDRPEFSFGEIKMAFENKLAQARGQNGIKAEDVVRLPAKILQTFVGSMVDLSKAVIDGTFAVGNEVKKAAEGAFKKEKEEETEEETEKTQ